MPKEVQGQLAVALAGGVATAVALAGGGATAVTLGSPTAAPVSVQGRERFCEGSASEICA